MDICPASRSPFPTPGVDYRDTVQKGDLQAVREIIASSGFFSGSEEETAVELVEERLRKGDASGYFFLFVEEAGSVLGYTCFGPIACTLSSYDLYWIALRDAFRGKGMGKGLLQRAEVEIGRMGGTRIYVETSSRDQYLPTRRFYEKAGYGAEAVLKDFYAPGDHKVVYVKALQGAASFTRSLPSQVQGAFHHG